MFKDVLEKDHKVFYKTIFNAFTNSRVNHAYLIVGDKGSPLLESAKFIAKSLICQENLACDNCIDCLRIDNFNYADLIFVDGGTESIKKNQIDGIQMMFSQSALEVSGKKVYIIHKIENSRPDTFNAILKFLEEPADNVYAILTTESISSILPTIISRCEVLRLSSVSAERIVELALNEGIESKYALVLGNIFNEILVIKEWNENPKLEIFYQFINGYFTKYSNLDDLQIYLMTVIAKEIQSKQELHLFLNMLELAYKDLFKIQNNNENIVYQEFLMIFKEKSSQVTAINDKIKEILICKKFIELNTSTALLLDRLSYLILR